MSGNHNRRPRLPKLYATFRVDTPLGGMLTTRNPEAALEFFYRDPENNRLIFQLDGKKQFHTSTLVERGLTELEYARRVARMRVYCLFQHHFRDSPRMYEVALADIITDTQRKGGTIYPSVENQDLLRRLQAMHRRAQRTESKLCAKELELSFKQMLLRNRYSHIASPSQMRRAAYLVNQPYTAHLDPAPTDHIRKTTHA